MWCKIFVLWCATSTFGQRFPSFGQFPGQRSGYSYSSESHSVNGVPVSESHFVNGVPVSTFGQRSNNIPFYNYGPSSDISAHDRFLQFSRIPFEPPNLGPNEYEFSESRPSSFDRNRVPNSPCPGIFGYYKDQQAKYFGLLVLPPLRTGARVINIRLSVKARLPQGDAGTIELAPTRSNGNAAYYVTFPIRNPLPEVEDIFVNGELVCEGQPGSSGSTILELTFEHSTQRDGNRLDKSRGYTPQIPIPRFTPDQERVTEMTTGRTTTQEPVRVANTRPASVDQNVCGIRNNVSPLIVGGKTASRGDWPWLAALYFGKGKAMEFKCAGSLISKRHVITAAHCIIPRDSDAYKEDQIEVVLARYQMSLRHESDLQTKKVKSYHVHEDYDFMNTVSDIAVLVLNNPVVYTKLISPICLWKSDQSLSNIVGRSGTVVGWGKTEKEEITDKPMQTEVRIVSQEECVRDTPTFKFHTNNRTLCAGFRDGKGPCSGDSGGALMIPFNDERGRQRWHLRGIVSIAITHHNKSCDLQQYVLYTDVVKFMPWLIEKMKN